MTYYYLQLSLTKTLCASVIGYQVVGDKDTAAAAVVDGS